MKLSTARRHRVGARLTAAALVGSALALLGTPANAATDPNDPSFTPVSADLIGVGSDTTQISLHKAAEAYNAGLAAGAVKVASFAATGGGQITLPGGAINRPNGSGAGKSLLYGASNNTDVDFARSSSTLNSTEISNNLQQIPFGLDTMVMAVSATDTNAPATLTRQQVVDIYSGKVTNWSEVGGKDGVIKPYRPQDGSGTLSFFRTNLQAANGGNPVTFTNTVTTTQEQDDTDIKGNPNAIVPISLGRAKLLGTLKYLGTNTATGSTDFAFPRAVYNVVRNGAQADPEIVKFFGSNGFLCSDAARPLIEAGGLEQLATPDADGVCGVATQAATSTFTTNVSQASTTALSVDVTKPLTVSLSATITGVGGQPSGTVTFTEGQTVVAKDVPLTGGVATFSGAATAGEHTYTATFTSDSPKAFQDSSDTKTVTVQDRFATSTALSVKSSAAGQGTFTATITSAGHAAPTTGAVQFYDADETALGGPVAVTAGKATVTRSVAPGKRGFFAVYIPTLDSDYQGSTSATTSATILTAAKISVVKPSKVKIGKTFKVTITVTNATTKASAGGTVTVKVGTKTVKSGTLRSGKVTLTLPAIKKSTTYTANYNGSGSVAKGKVSFKVTAVR